jgi:PAS domain S-box-containing protein
VQSDGTVSLYERLGGVDSVAVIVSDFVDRLTHNSRLTHPLIDEQHQDMSEAAFKYLLTEMFCAKGGGPQTFTGESLARRLNESKRTGIDWEIVLNDFQQTLDSFNVPPLDQIELKAILNGARSKPAGDGRQFLHDIIAAVPSVIYVFDIHQQRVVFVNRPITPGPGSPAAPDVQDAGFMQSVLHPDDLQPFMAYLERLAQLPDGETADFEYRTRLDKGNWHWLHSRDRVLSRNEDGTVRQIIGTATDATDRKAVEARIAFLANLNQALVPLADPEQIVTVALRMLGDHLEVDRCGYAEVDADEDHFTVIGDYARGPVPSIVGRFRMSDFGDRERQVLMGNRPYVVNDIVAESPPGTDLSLYERGAIRSMVCVPLNKGGNFVARMAVHQSSPRHWSKAEIELVTKVAQRCWESVERARAVRRWKDADDRYRAFIANSSEAIWRYELEQPIPLLLSPDQQVEMLFKYAYLAECNDAMAHMYGYDSPDQIIGVPLRDLLIASDPKNIAYLRALRDAGYSLNDFETHEVDRFGNTKYFMNSLTAIQENGFIVRAWGTQRDITEQKVAEQALHISEERLRRITDATQDALWEIDLKTNQLWWSEGARPLFGHSPSELSIGLEDWYAGIHRDDVDRVRTRFEEFMRGTEDDWADEYRFRRADGIYVYISDQGRKFLDENGAPTRIAGAMVDISERKMAETGLRESEERYRQLTELSPDGIVLVDAVGTILLANPSMLQMFRMAPEHVIGHNLFDFLTPEYVEHCRDWMKTIMTTGTPYIQVEAAFRNRDGHDFPVEISALRFDWKGMPYAQIVIHDISGHKQAEAERLRLTKEIQAESDRLKQILEQMPIGVAIAEAPAGRLIFHNLEAVRLFRHPLLPSKDFKDYSQYGSLHLDGSPYLPEEHPAARSILNKAVVKGEEMRYLRGDGTETYFSVDSAPIYDAEGHIVLAVVTFIDIGERRKSEQALRESEERFAKAFQASPNSLVISRLADGVVLEVNDSFVAATGYSRDEIVGKSTILLGLYANPEDRRRALKLMKEQGRVREIEISLKRKNGELRLMMFSAEPFELRGEHCWLTIGYDITERRQTEKERERLLQQEKTAREEAETANRMKDEFLATISHELRTPLTSILGWAQMLIDGALPESQAQHALQVIERSAQSQRELIDNILDTSRIITGRLKLDARPIRIEEVFQAAVDVIRPSADAKGIDLQVRIDDGDCLVLGDTNRLQQAIWNLLSNAVKFTNQDGRVEARLTRVAGQVEILIADTGIGIEPEFLPYVFDRFRQADSTSTRKYGGLGLGLAIVRHVVEMHGGRVFVSSPGPGKGSAFRIRLPVALSSNLQQIQSRPLEEVSSQRSQPAPRQSCDSLTGLRVLVVEDHPDTLELIRFILEKCGATVATAPSASEALAILDRWTPNALVSDLAMPNQDGYDLIAKVRARGPGRGGNIPAVALTAYARAEDRARTLAAGFQKHISKPVDPDELVAVVASLAIPGRLRSG